MGRLCAAGRGSNDGTAWLVCHPEKGVQSKRVKMWMQGGVSIQREYGTI